MKFVFCFALIAMLAAMTHGNGNLIHFGMAAIATGVSLLGTDVKTMNENGYSRNIVIEISNYLPVTLYGGATYLWSGRVKFPAPTTIGKETREVMMFQKASDSAVGVSGLVSYRIGNSSNPASFVVGYSIPYNYIHSRNWMALKLVDEKTPIGLNLYNELYYDSLWHYGSVRNDRSYQYAMNHRPAIIIHENYVITATMSESERCYLKVTIMEVEAENKRELFATYK